MPKKAAAAPPAAAAKPATAGKAPAKPAPEPPPPPTPPPPPPAIPTEDDYANDNFDPLSPTPQPPPAPVVPVETPREDIPPGATACFECQKRVAVLWCLDCQADLCEKCETSLHKPRLFGTHKRVPEASKPPPLVLCATHGENMKLFCLNSSCRYVNARISLCHHAVACAGFGRRVCQQHACVWALCISLCHAVSVACVARCACSAECLCAGSAPPMVNTKVMSRASSRMWLKVKSTH